MHFPKKIILDTNVFLLYLIGRIAPHKIKTHKRTSIYAVEDYNFLISTVNNIGSDLELIICPNITTEVDNLLNNTFQGYDKEKYVYLSKEIYKKSVEVYIKTIESIEQYTYYDLGITDSVILLMAKNCDLLISGDSKLCDYARSMDIPLLDFKGIINQHSYAKKSP